MATINEKIDSREVCTGANPSAILKYFIEGLGTDEDILALAAVKAASPVNFWVDSMNLQRQDITATPLGDDTWEGVVRYGKYAPLLGGISAYTFEIGSETQHITQSKATTGYVESGTATDNLGAIGSTPDGVEGVDIDAGSYEWSETYQLVPSAITLTYRMILFNLRRKVNGATWRGFAAGEVRFMGCTGSYKTGDAFAEITYRFKAQPNVTNQTIGSITGIDKKGWEYLWVRYAEEKDAVSKIMRKVPKEVFVEKVYDDDGDYTQLGIGT